MLDRAANVSKMQLGISEYTKAASPKASSQVKQVLKIRPGATGRETKELQVKPFLALLKHPNEHISISPKSCVRLAFF
jgi:hypothetical protein